MSLLLTQIVTASLCLLGMGFAVGGLCMVVRSKSLERRCTEVAEGSIVEIRDESFGGRFKKRAAAVGKREKEEPVVAANEAIAAKKRAYKEKKRRQAADDLAAGAATWRPVVRYEVDGRAFEQKATRATIKGHFKVGQDCTVRYDPRKPDYCWLSIDGLPGAIGAILSGGGALLVVMGVICWFVLPTLGQTA